MQLHQTEPIFGKNKAHKLKLSSHRFSSPEMSENATEAINHVKLKDRP